MRVFADTSAILAVLDADDANHLPAKEQWIKLISEGTELWSSSYVLVESFALIQHRLGMEALRAFQEDVVPVIAIHWVDEAAHHASVAAVLVAARKGLSLVDCSSFDIMRRLGLKKAFSFDRHFREQGFHCIPEVPPEE